MHVLRSAVAGLVVAAAAMHPGAMRMVHAAEPAATADRDAARLSADGGRYHGPLKDGRFDGKGRLEWPSGAVYEGEFVDGMFHGKGRWTMASGDVYDGSFVQGQPHGQGRLSERSGDVFEGNFERGQLHGRGRHQGTDQRVYEGDFANTWYEGHGRFDDGQGAIYEGAFKDGMFHGRGKLRSQEGEFDGEFARGRLNGLGRASYRNGTSYRGMWQHNVFHGRGEFIDERGTRYTGDFAQGRFSGYGMHSLPDGARFEGRFADWRPDGPGRITDAQGTVFDGKPADREGRSEGRIVWKDGSRYEGQAQGQMPHGWGVLHKANGDVYRGHFAYGDYDGEGTLSVAKPRDGRSVIAGTWTYGRFKPDDDEQRRRAGQAVEDALYAQPALLERSLASIAPSEPARTRMYLLAIAGDGAQEVFRREAEFVRRQFDADYGTAGRSVVLVNSRNTAQQLPMASVTSVRRAIDAIAAKMDREKDILFLFMTSHGSRTHEFSLGLRGMDLPPLTPKDLRAMLAASGIRWKVVVVSACYAGGFVDSLKDERTLVLAAARHDRRSFGCADENEFTYFGRAFFKEALPKSTSFQQAFATAGKLIEQWESNDHRRERRGGHDEARHESAGGESAQDRTAGPTGQAIERRSLPQIADAKPIADRLAEWWTQRSAK